MKKILGLFLCIMIILSAGFVLADRESSNNAIENNEGGNSLVISPNSQGQAVENRVITGNNGEEIELEIKERIRLRVRNISAYTELNLTEEPDENRTRNQTRLKVMLSNGRNAEIKIMPDTASETALIRLRLRVCNESNNCTLVLKEAGEGNQAKIIYSLEAENQYRVFGLFRKQIKVRAEVSAETGEIISSNKPWWAF